MSSLNNLCIFILFPKLNLLKFFSAGLIYAFIQTTEYRLLLVKIDLQNLIFIHGQLLYGTICKNPLYL